MRALLLISLLLGIATAAHAAVVPDTPYHRSYNTMLDWLENDPSPVADIRVIGTADDGRDIEAVVVSDNPTIEEDEPVFLFVGVIHGREVLGGRVVLEVIETLTEGYGTDPDVTEWVDRYQIWFVPVMNPWGYDNQQRKNGPDTGVAASSGVDLNRNFDFRWDPCLATDPNSGTFSGPGADSEPETEAIAALIREIRPILGITFHSGQGGPKGSILYPWGTADVGADCIDGNCDDLIVSDPTDKQEGRDLAIVIRDAVEASRAGTRLCDGTTTIVGDACNLSGSIGTLGSSGASSAWAHAATGMFDILIETNGDLDGDGTFELTEAWRDDYFYQNSPTLNATQQAHFDDAVAYTQSYHDGILAIFDHFICGNDVNGPGVTGRVIDPFGNSLTATIRILERDTTLDVDFVDLDCDGSPDAPAGGTDLDYRRTNSSFGRYYRVLDPGTYTVEATILGGTSATQTVTVSAGCMEEVNFTLQIYDVFVDGSFGPGGNGSFILPFDTVQEGVNAVNPGDSVGIAGGNYPEAITIGLTPAKAMFLRNYNGVVVIGE